MKNVAQITQDELIQLIAEKLGADGFKVIPKDYAVQFVTSADGKTSALVSGLVKEETPEVPPVETPGEKLDRDIRVALQEALTFKPQTQENLVKQVLETLVQTTGAAGAKPSTQRKRQVNALVILALQAWAEEGKVVYVEEIDSWHKVRASKSTAAQAAADILGGTGGAMGRGDALGAGISD